MSKVKKALDELERFCEAQGQRLTAPREHVMAIIAASSKPMTAYEVLEALAAKIDNPKPPTAYRALDFLMAHGFVHRIESLNAYISCHEGHKHSGSQFMICDICGDVREAHLCKIPEGLQRQADDSGYSITHWNAELHGLCSKCCKPTARI